MLISTVDARLPAINEMHLHGAVNIRIRWTAYEIGRPHGPLENAPSWEGLRPHKETEELWTGTNPVWLFCLTRTNYSVFCHLMKHEGHIAHDTSVVPVHLM